MKVYVVTANSWNGEHSVVSVHAVTTDAEAAYAFVKIKADQKAASGSSYATDYEVEEFDTSAKII